MTDTPDTSPEAVEAVLTRFDAVRRAYGSGLHSVHGAGVLADVDDTLRALSAKLQAAEAALARINWERPLLSQLADAEARALTAEAEVARLRKEREQIAGADEARRKAYIAGTNSGWSAAIEAASDLKLLIPLIEKQSCGEWNDSTIASDARLFRDAIRALMQPRRREAMTDIAARSLTFTYTNWRGETAERWATPLEFRWGTTEWHPQPCWLMRALDHEKGEEREFALADCQFHPEGDCHE